MTTQQRTCSTDTCNGRGYVECWQFGCPPDQEDCELCGQCNECEDAGVIHVVEMPTLDHMTFGDVDPTFTTDTSPTFGTIIDDEGVRCEGCASLCADRFCWACQRDGRGWQ